MYAIAYRVSIFNGTMWLEWIFLLSGRAEQEAASECCVQSKKRMKERKLPSHGSLNRQI